MSEELVEKPDFSPLMIVLYNGKEQDLDPFEFSREYLPPMLDPLELDAQLMRATGNLSYWTSILAHATRLRDQARQLCERIEAEIYLRLKQPSTDIAGKVIGKPPTEQAVAYLISLDTAVLKVRELLLFAEERLRRISGFVKALEIRTHDLREISKRERGVIAGG